MAVPVPPVLADSLQTARGRDPEKEDSPVQEKPQVWSQPDSGAITALAFLGRTQPARSAGPSWEMVRKVGGRLAPAELWGRGKVF